MGFLIITTVFGGGFGLGSEYSGFALLWIVVSIVLIRWIAAEFFVCPHCRKPAEIHKDELKFCPSCGHLIDGPTDEE